MNVQAHPRVLSIAGSDPVAGAGIQADLKTISALGGYACTAITAVTVQNTQGVYSLNPMSADVILAQCEAIFDDVKIDAVKIGMLPNIQSVEVVAGVLRKYQPKFVVWDPVMAATSGDALVTENIADELMNLLLPLVHILTPNLLELAQLTHCNEAAITDEGQIKAQAYALLNRGAKAVLAKGGHFHGDDATDWLVMDGFERAYRTPRVRTQNTHGSGCTLSSAIACLRGQSHDLPEAVKRAKAYIQAAIEGAVNWQVGQGHGPLAHFHEFMQPKF